MKPAALVVPLALLAAAACGRPRSEAPAIPAWGDEPAIGGTLRISGFGAPGGGGAASPRHERTWVNGADGWHGHEDVDLRGFLDGVFRYGWNQPGQVHVRIGRRDDKPGYGEHELFRVAHRLEGVTLPAGAEVEDATFTIDVEVGPPHPVRVMLYELRRDWNPGQGGTFHDNVSPPNPGEVWWNDAAYGQRPWGLPGVGFASDDDPDADTAGRPLAEAACAPDQDHIVFRSPALAAYARDRATRGLPLGFLVKLSDFHEDQPGSLLNAHSGNQGDSVDTALRPRLTLSWTSPGDRLGVEERILLEHGRTWTTPRLTAAGLSEVHWSFAPDEGHDAPTVQVREGRGGAAGPWRPAPARLEPAGEWVQFRLLGALHPVLLGEPFTATVRNTWIRTKAPEEQVVPWTFLSPTGERHEVRAAYDGDHSWSVRFVPDEVGTWTYSWAQSFTEEPFRSAPVRFDVVIDDLPRAVAQVRAFTSRLREAGGELDAPGVSERWRKRFLRLERAGLLLEGPATWPTSELRQALREARAAFGEPVPEPIPLVPNKRPPWERPQAP